MWKYIHTTCNYISWTISLALFNIKTTTHQVDVCYRQKFQDFVTDLVVKVKV